MAGSVDIEMAGPGGPAITAGLGGAAARGASGVITGRGCAEKPGVEDARSVGAL